MFTNSREVFCINRFLELEFGKAPLSDSKFNCFIEVNRLRFLESLRGCIAQVSLEGFEFSLNVKRNGFLLYLKVDGPVNNASLKDLQGVLREANISMECEKDLGTVKVSITSVHNQIPDYYCQQLVLSKDSNLYIENSLCEKINMPNASTQTLDRLHKFDLSNGPKSLFYHENFNKKTVLILISVSSLQIHKDFFIKNGFLGNIVFLSENSISKELITKHGVEGFRGIEINQINWLKISPPEKPEAALIEDYQLVHMVWEMSVNGDPNRYWAFKNAQDFLDQVHLIDRNTPIYIDGELENGVRGELVARRLRERLGFKTINFATSLNPKEFGEMPWIDAFVSKDPPWDNKDTTINL